METQGILRLWMLLLVLVVKPVFSQDDVKSTLIGSPSSEEAAANIVADNAGNTYVGGLTDNKGLIVKQDALHVTLWSKTIAFTTNPNDGVVITFLDLKGDTLFGCGKIYPFNLPNQVKGTFYFKMNAQTGAMYWSKYELVSNTYLSCMRYANGKFFLVGGGYYPAQGKVIAVSSQTGNIIWQTPLLGYEIALSSTTPVNRTYFMNATEVKNGKFYITGYAVNGNLQGIAMTLGMPLLIGITETGTVFLTKYVSLPYIPTTVQRFVGSLIRWDMDDNLVIAVFEVLGNAFQDKNTIIVKCDQGGTVLFANRYNIGDNLRCTIQSMNETSSAYVLFGYAVINVAPYDGVYVQKIDKNGNLQACNNIYKPNVFYDYLWMGGVTVDSRGNSSFINNQHYFTMVESGDINQYILDEDLQFIGDCSETTSIPVEMDQVPATTPQLIATTTPQTMIFQNGVILENPPVYGHCDSLSLSLSQVPECNESTTITANLNGFTNPIFYWSTGNATLSNQEIVTTTDTVILRVLDIRCCELIDTIVPTILPSSFTMSLPVDTTLCLLPGASLTITPAFSGANGPVQYLWSNNSTGTSLAVTTSGTYWLEISDSCLTRRDSIAVTVNLLPVIGNTANVTVCEDDFPATLNPTVSSGVSVLWEDSSTTIPRSVSGPGLYALSATNNCGTVNANIVVLQTDLPEVNLVSLVDTCIQNGTSILLVPTFTGTTAVLWSDGSTGNQLPVSASGTYTVFASNVCGTSSASCSVTINHFPELDLPATLDTCFEVGVGFAYTAHGSGGIYQWSSGSQTATTWISQEGTVSCTLTNVCGTITDSMQVRRMTAVDLYFPEDSIRDCQKQLSVSLLHVETNYNLEIFAPNGNLVGTYLTESGWYTIHAFNPCAEVWDSIYVNLQNEQFFYLPNAFSPNADTHNERYVYQGENITVQSMRIFNRWGEEIFSQTGDFTGWDGTYKGEACPMGMYAVSVIYEDCFGMPTEFNGHVNLLR